MTAINAVNKRCTEKMFKVNKNLEFSPLHERDNNINNIPVSNNNNDNDNDSNSNVLCLPSAGFIELMLVGPNKYLKQTSSA